LSFTKEASLIEHKAYRDTWGRGLDSYLQWFYETASTLHEMLHETGCLYVHLDWHVSFYAKAILDEIFGPERFINEIVWKRQTAKGDVTQGARHMGRIHESIFLYTKTEQYDWNIQYTAYEKDYVDAAYRNQDSDGRRYTLSDITAPGGGKASKGNPRYEFLGVTRYWRFSKDTMERLHKEGKIVQPLQEQCRGKNATSMRCRAFHFKTCGSILARFRANPPKPLDMPLRSRNGCWTG
jgi:adenine specific DNA methylase Mod